jgi:hypothetical protein
MVGRAFPGLLPRVTTYEEFVGLYLHVEWERAARVTDTGDGVAVGTGKATVPNSWIDLLTDDPGERARWRLREFRKDL